jgi:molybdate-binding protein/DNA-binding XRE family transcriptional regulator
MADGTRLENEVRAFREREGWTQYELALQTGLSRAGISGIETGRLVPSTAAALALARAFGCTVEELFQLSAAGMPSGEAESPWAWPAPAGEYRYWRAEVSGRVRAYPVEVSSLGLIPHDGTSEHGGLHDQPRTSPENTLVVAGCDPAAGLLAEELAREADVRLIVLQRSSAAALDLLERGLVHAAGVHLGRADDADGNRRAVLDHLRSGRENRLIRVADWDEGIAVAPGLGLKSVHDLLTTRIHWVYREAGSGAQKCLEELLGHNRPRRRSEGVRLAFDHRGVAGAIRGGWADAGVCLRLTSQEANLDFLEVQREAYDLCFPASLAGDPRLRALVRTLRSATYRRLLAALPGYHTARTGEIQKVPGANRPAGLGNP